jgi:hypothetical protein
MASILLQILWEGVTYEEVEEALQLSLDQVLGHAIVTVEEEEEDCSMRLPLSYDLAAEMCTVYIHVCCEESSLTAPGNTTLAPTTKGSICA